MAMSLSDKVELIRLLAGALGYQATGGDNRWLVRTEDNQVLLMTATPDDTLTSLIKAAAIKLTSPEEDTPRRKRK